MVPRGHAQSTYLHTQVRALADLIRSSSDVDGTTTSHVRQRGPYWLPLGAGDNTHCLRINGRIFE
jgi:hypothetical protein